jgi:hypothetical protein
VFTRNNLSLREQNRGVESGQLLEIKKKFFFDGFSGINGILTGLG